MRFALRCFNTVKQKDTSAKAEVVMYRALIPNGAELERNSEVTGQANRYVRRRSVRPRVNRKSPSHAFGTALCLHSNAPPLLGAGTALHVPCTTQRNLPPRMISSRLVASLKRPSMMCSRPARRKLNTSNTPMIWRPAFTGYKTRSHSRATVLRPYDQHQPRILPSAQTRQARITKPHNRTPCSGGSRSESAGRFSKLLRTCS